MFVIMLAANKDECLLHLISNAQPELYNNKANHFKTQLDTQLSFPERQQWEIGLKEFGYVNNVDTVVNDHKIRIGKVYESSTLNRYLPHYLIEGGSEVKIHYIYSRKLVDKLNELTKLDPIDAFRRYLTKSDHHVLQLKADYSSVFYLGSNGLINKNDIYTINLKTSTAFELLENKQSRYALIFSSALAQVFQLDQCVYVTEPGKDLRIITKISASQQGYEFPAKKASEAGDKTEDYTFAARDYWFSVIPLHRTLFSSRHLYSSKLGSISILELLQQLAWYDLGYLSIENEKKCTFHFRFDGSLIGIFYNIFKTFLLDKNLDISIGAGQKIIFPTIEAPAEVNDTTKIREQLEEEEKRMKKQIEMEKKSYEKKHDDFLKIAQKREEVEKQYEALWNAPLVYNNMIGKKIRLINQETENNLQQQRAQLDKQMKAAREMYEKQAENMENIRKQYQEIQKESENYYKSYYSQTPPAFLDMIPTDLDLVNYTTKLALIIGHFNSLPTSTTKEQQFKNKYSQDLNLLVQNNSILFFFNREQVIVIHKKGKKVDQAEYELENRIPAGFYTIFTLLKAIQDKMHTNLRENNMRNSDAFSLSCVPCRRGFKILLHLPKDVWITVSTGALKKSLFAHHAEYRNGNELVVEVKSSELHVTRELIREYTSQLGDMIEHAQSPTATQTQQQHLINMATRSRNVIHLKDTAKMYYYFYDADDERLIHEDVKQFDQCLNQTATCSQTLPFHVLRNENLKNPLEIDIPRGYYTPYTLAYTMNENIPFYNLYWFTPDNDDEYYSIKLKLPKGASIQFDAVLSDILETNCFEEASSDKTKTRYVNGSEIKILACCSRIREKGCIFPFRNMDLTQVRHTPKGLSPVQDFMYKMFHLENANRIRYGNRILRSNLHVGFLKNEKSMFYFIQGMKIKVKHKTKPLNEVVIPYSPHTPLLHHYSTQLENRKNDVFTIDEPDFLHTFQEVVIPRGQYTIQTLIEKVQRGIKPWLPDVAVTLNEQHFLTIQSGSHNFIDLREFKHLLNLNVDYIGPDTTYISPVPVDIVPPSFNIIIYCNLVGETYVGGQRERILRIFPTTKHKLGEMINETMTTVDYYDLYLKDIKEIEISFRGDDGEFIPISQGRSYVKLHLRRRTLPQSP